MYVKRQEWHQLTPTLLFLEGVVFSVDDDVPIQLVIAQLKGIHYLHMAAGLLAYQGSQNCGQNTICTTAMGKL